MGGQTPAEDDIDRQLRELTEGRAGAARFREPSAAERAEAAKERAKAAKQARKQAKARAREARRMVRRAPRPRAALVTSWTVAIAILGVTVWLGYQHVRHGGSTVAGSAVGAINSQPAPSGAVSAPAPTGPGADPFTGTPADDWADGAAGITVPTANPVGPFTAAQVAGAYATTRKLLIAQTLDPTTLRGGPPTAFEDLLNPAERKVFISGLTKSGLDKDGVPANTRAYLTSFAPGTTSLIGSVIKVHGTMHARVGTDQGQQVLYVDVNYRMVYPVEPPHNPANWMRIVTMDYGHVEFWDWANPAHGAPLEPVTYFLISPSGGKCGMADGYLHPDFPGSPPDGLQPRGKLVDPYSMQVPNINTVCVPAIGT
jgi:hypothetical protein